MRQKKYILLFLLFITSAGSIFLIARIIKLLNKQNNAFIRHYPPHFLSSLRTLDLNYNSFYIAGHSAGHIYLGNTKAPGCVLVANDLLTDTQYHNLSLPEGSKLFIDASRWQLNYPFMNLVDSKSSTIIQTQLPELSIYERYNLTVQFPEEIKAVSKSSFVYKHYNPALQQSILSKYRGTGPDYTPEKPLLEKQLDGHFCLDGQLLYSSGSATIVYLYYYRNEFLCLDTNLNLQFRGKTIDTNSVAKITLDTIFFQNGDKNLTFNKPPLIINKAGSVSDNLLFINSRLIADNDDPNLFDNQTAIDIYDLTKKNYLYSFLLPDYKGNKLKQFMVFGKKLIALYEQYMVTWDLKIP